MDTKFDANSNRYRDSATGRFISFNTQAKIQLRLDRITRAVNRANEGWLNAVGYLVSMFAKEKVKRSKTAAPAGQPPTTRKGLLRRAIRYEVAADRKSVVIGPTFSKVGTSAEAHEYGGRFKGERYPKRPLMGPALDEAAPRLGPKYKLS